MNRIAKGMAGLLVTGVLVAGGLLLWGGPLADIRPDVITIEAQPEREARGRALIDTALQAHGGAEAFTAHETRRFQVEDEWVGMLANMFNPWPDETVRGEVVQKAHSFDSTVTFVGGNRPGSTWGITEGKAWERDGPGAAVSVDNSDLAFILPTLHYFVELPLRLPEAEVFRHVGTESIGGIDYEVVFVTWRSPEASPDFDQYLVYIDPKTGRIAKIQYTVREIMKMAVGTAHLLDQKQVGGVWMATRMPVTDQPSDDPAAFVHEFRLSDISLGSEEVETLEP